MFEFLCDIEGVAENGSLRNIEITSNSNKKTYDLYDFVYKSNFKQNPLIKTGDKIFVPYMENRITILGNVLKPGIYELKDNDEPEDLLKISGGLSTGAFTEQIIIQKNGMNSYSENILKINLKDINSKKNIIETDVIYIPSLKSHQDDSMIHVYGQINKQGTIPFKEE